MFFRKKHARNTTRFTHMLQHVFSLKSSCNCPERSDKISCEMHARRASSEHVSGTFMYRVPILAKITRGIYFFGPRNRFFRKRRIVVKKRLIKGVKKGPQKEDQKEGLKETLNSCQKGLSFLMTFRSSFHGLFIVLFCY